MLTSVFENIETTKKLNLNKFEKGKITYKWLHIVSNGIAQPIYIPIMVARGKEDGPVLGLTAAVHGNELNGISVIQKLFTEIEVEKIKGTIVGVPVVNIPGLYNNSRLFIDGKDLNRIMPGKPNGNVSEVYAYRVLDRIVKNFDYLLDLHTASFGRVNSFYIRADLGSKEALTLAQLQEPQIILNAPAADGTLRGAAADLGIHAITVEVGDPNRFQKGMVKSSLTRIFNTLNYLGIYQPEELKHNEGKPIICDSSQWIYTEKGGILSVYPQLTDIVEEGELVGLVRNVFGEEIEKYYAPRKGIVIGRSVNPIAQTGSRIIHLGKV